MTNGLNVLVERQVLNSDCKTTAGHVELLVNGFHLLSQDVNLLDGGWFEKVLQEVHLVVKWFHLQGCARDPDRTGKDTPVPVWSCFRKSSRG